MFEATPKIATLISWVQPDIWNLEADTGRPHKVTGRSGQLHCCIWGGGGRGVQCLRLETYDH